MDDIIEDLDLSQIILDEYSLHGGEETELVFYEGSEPNSPLSLFNDAFTPDDLKYALYGVEAFALYATLQEERRDYIKRIARGVVVTRMMRTDTFGVLTPYMR